MNCKEAYDYLLDALQEGSGRTAGLDDHLRSCANCARELQAMRQTMTLLDAWEAPEPSPYFDSRLRARLRDSAAAPRSWLEWARKPAIAFALAALMVASIALFRNAPNHTVATNQNSSSATHIGTAVNDLQELEHDGDMYANFDLLDDLGTEAETANP